MKTLDTSPPTRASWNGMIQIKNLTIDGRLILAPLAGYTDSPFRRIARANGAAMTVTELISAEGIARRVPKSMNLLRFHQSERPLAVQLFGKSPDVMAEAASIVEGLCPDCIDINLGCPAPKVCQGGEGAGSALLLDPDKIFSVADRVVRTVTLPVSAKIRIGWDEGRKNYREVVQALESAGVAMIAVHGRTVSQKYSGRADWDIIREIREMSRVPVIGNGDIDSYRDALVKLDESGCSAVMIGRGAIGNPWIFSGRMPSIEEIVAQMEKHLDFMIELYGNHGIIMMRKHFAKYIHGFRNASRWREQLVRVSTRSDAADIFASLLQGDTII